MRFYFLILYSRFVFFCLLVVSGVALAGPGSAVFNSFTDRSLALKESAQVARRFGIDARIEQAMIKGTTYHRVLGPVMDQSSVGELVRQARTNGYVDTWVLPSKQQPRTRLKQRKPGSVNAIAQDPNRVNKSPVRKIAGTPLQLAASSHKRDVKSSQDGKH